MTGRMIVTEPERIPEKHTHVIIRFGDFDIHYNDVRRFGFMDLVRSDKLGEVKYLCNLGPDPFEIGEEIFSGIVKSKKRMIKQLLLDQNTISGLGNIYSDEILFAAGIHPRSISFRIGKKRLARLYDVTIETLNRAIKARGSSVSDFVDGSGAPGKYQNFHYVYGREGKPCKKCGALIKREIIASRSAHFCPRCQRK
jgi:formamidopyrimidine-DNA glycosylase